MVISIKAHFLFPCSITLVVRLDKLNYNIMEEHIKKMEY
jgi:hypothetical protein